MRTVIGLDIGHSAVKVSIAHGQGATSSFIFPSHACPAVVISDEAAAQKARMETVVINGEKWFFGNTALLQGRNLSSGLSDNWIHSDEHAALFMGALRTAKTANIPNVDNALILVGLPGRLFKGQREALENHLRRFAPTSTIKVIPQPSGPYYQLITNERGEISNIEQVRKQSWAIVEVGHYTTDFALYKEGTFVDWAITKPCDGLSKAVLALIEIVQSSYGISMNIEEATEAIQHKFIKNFGENLNLEIEVEQAYQMISKLIVDHATQVFKEEARRLDGIILAGGGASVVYPHLKHIWPSTIVPENPRFSVADGYVRYGIGFIAAEYRRKAAQDANLKAVA